MTDRCKADTYLMYLDQILAGEKEVGPVEDAEVEKILFLAKTMLSEDFSNSSLVRETVRIKLIAQVVSTYANNNDKVDKELDDEELDYVNAAGYQAHSSPKSTCLICGCSSQIINGICPRCTH